MALPRKEDGRKFVARQATLLAFAVFLITFGARLWLIERYASPVPFMDQWDGEAGSVIQPWLDDRLSWQLILSPHNEHRVAVSRLTTLLLFRLNGRWDPLVETVVSSAVYAMTLSLLALGFRRLVPPRFALAVTCGVIVIGILPFGWENTLFGFQSQFYYLVLFSLLALWGLGTQRVFGGAWWLGVGASLLACITLASGCFAALTVLATALAFAAVLGRRAWQPRDWVTCLVCVAIVTFGLATQTTVPGHAVLRAQSWEIFARAFLQCLAWPWTLHPFVAIAIYAPVVLWIWCAWRALECSSSDQFWSRGLILVIAWVAVQSAAIAYARGAGWLIPSSRYTDLFAIGALVNFAAVLRLVEMSPANSTARRLAWSGLVAWTALVCAGLTLQTRSDLLETLPGQSGMLKSHESLIRDYAMTGDSSGIDGKKFSEIPYLNSDRIVGFMRDPRFRAILPASLLHSPTVSPPASDFDPGVLSRVADFLLRQSLWLMALGIAAFAWFHVRVARSPNKLGA